VSDGERRPAFVQIHAIARGDRSAMTAKIRDAFGEAGAFLTDVRFFSGVMTVFVFEGDAGAVRALALALGRAGVGVDDAGRAAIGRLGDEQTVAGTLAVAFPEGDPDLRRDVPSVPG